ncbi:hypothetical protein O3G_MSEX006035 [Manduca sexta]|uniref:CHK kinase-like domain-containing protein n=1 Tax=Manduca sexta TaxID=7130 RepID=A0A921Z229_MANSE|nr:hypothetical protein O3G_MSEX006035 [Manduca sexta]
MAATMARATRALTDLLDKIASTQKYKDPVIQLNPINSKGANYTSQLFGVTIKGENKPDLNLFAKVAVIGEKVRTQGICKVFDTEHYMYTKLMPIYREIEERQNVPEEHRLQMPKYYGCTTKEYEEVLVLEDLTTKGYEVRDRLKELDWKFATAALTELAKIHSLSFAYGIENPEDFDQSCDILNVAMNNDDAMNVVWRRIANKAIEMTVDQNKEWMQNFLMNYGGQSLLEYAKPLRRPALIHGDFRVSNMMQKIDENGRVHVKIVDYQTAQAASPIIDLLYFIFSSSSEEFRAKYYDKLIEHYYTQLSLAIKRIGYDPEQVYSREDFDFEYKKKLPFGLHAAVFTVPLVTIDAANAPKMDEDMDISRFSMENKSALFPERLNGVVNDFIRWGVTCD